MRMGPLAATVLIAWVVLAPASGQSALTGQPAKPARLHPPSKWVLGPWYGTGFPDFGKTAASGGKTHEDEIAYDLDNLVRHDIPITTYHCDGTAWARADRIVLSDALIRRMGRINVRLLVHLWGQDDLATWKDTHARTGGVLGGYYLDEKFKARIGGDDATSAKALELVRGMVPDGEVILKTYGPKTASDECLRRLGHVCYVNDLGVDYRGLQTGIRRVFAKSQLLPAPYNEFTAYDVDRNRRPPEEVYFRRLHWGAMQVIMDNSPWVDCDPWTWGYSPRLLEAYRYWSWLHLELAAYLHSYDYHAYETNQMIFRDPDPKAFTTRLGEELFVAYVTDRVTELPIALPAGEWINYWDESQLVTGPAQITLPVPSGREPIFIRNGALIPLDVSRPYTGHGTAESAGSLTVLVHPRGRSAFRYRDDRLNAWVVFTSALVEKSLTLTASRAPARPVLYRIARWPAAPESVAIDGLTVKINQGGGIPKATTEKEVNASPASAWFHDAATGRLIVKAWLKE